MNKTISSLSVLALAALACTAAQAQGHRTASGSFNGMQWEAHSLLIGTQTTGTLLSTSGNAAYHPSYPAYSGVVGLLMNYDAGSFICTGTLLPDRQSILTAAHCVSEGYGSASPNSTTVFFQPAAGLPVGQSIYNHASATAIAVTDYYVNPGYTGQVIDHNDIAVVRLASAAPDWAMSHDIVTTPDLTGAGFNVAGYGQTGAGASGTSGINALLTLTGRLRQGDNRYDFRWGDADWGGMWQGAFDNPDLPSAQIEFSYVSDFDSGNAANDASCLLAASEGLGGAKYCNTGLGLREVGLGGGDSGGPAFMGGRVSSVNSYGLTFGVDFGDAVAGVNSTFGEFSGYVPTYIHADFIYSAMIPEPQAYALMLLGLAGVGAVVRRRRKQA